MAIVHLVIAAALLQFLVFGVLVARARIQYQVKAPAITGHPVFERYFRVHYNTLEQLVAFVPGAWLFGTYVSATWAAGLGVLYLVARVVYLRGYVADPGKRGVGFGLSMLPTLVLVIGGLVGAAVAAFG